MSNEGTADLCRWLRDNSSGIYRNAAVAAVVIESQHAELIERQSEIDRLRAEVEALTLPPGRIAVDREKLERIANAIYSKLCNAEEHGDAYDVGYFRKMLDDLDAMIAAQRGEGEL